MLISFFLYSFTIVKVGLEISFSRPKKDKKPSVNFVFPEPNSPQSTIKSPFFSFEASTFAIFFVSFSDYELYI